MKKHSTLDHIDLPPGLLESWQKTVNLLAETARVPAALIMRVHAREIEVFVRSQSQDNVYERGERADLDTGLYCETVMDTRKELLVTNALVDPEWDHNPDIKLGMISYYGLPIIWPVGPIFGTICMLDTKENHFSALSRNLLEQFRDAVQIQLESLYKSYLLEQAHEELVEVNEGLDRQVAERTAHLEREIVKRKNAETELRESEEKFRNLVENSLLGIFVHQNYKILFANQAYAEMLGFDSSKEVLQLDSVIPLMHTDDVPGLEDRNQKSIEGRVVPPRHEFRVVRRDGEINYLNSHTVNVMWEGQLARMGTVIDITESKKIEEQLHQAQKMEAVGQLAGGVAHDFNNMLGSILINAEILEMELGQPNRKIQNVIRATTRGAELTERLLAFSREQALHSEVIGINTLVEGMVDLLQRTLGETIAVETDLDEDLWLTLIDPGQMENALLNLAINARDAMPRGGKLTIETSNAPLDDDDASALGDLLPGQHIRLSVLDTGEGMTPEVMNHVFEPFFTTKEFGKGTGLGLSMIYGFVKQSGGHIMINSKEGQGTAVNIYLPASDGDATEAEGPPDTEEFQPEGEAILVVEDNMDLRENVVHLLETFGYKTYWAGNGEEALTRLEDKPDIDLLLCDVVLPGGKSGPDIAMEARHQHPSLIVVFMSGYAPTETPSVGQLPKGALLLKKPFTKSELAQVLRDGFKMN